MKASTQRANRPFHQTPSSNQDVMVFSGRVMVSYPDGFRMEGDGTIRFCWLPSPGPRFEVKQPGVFSLCGFDATRLSDVSIDVSDMDIAGLSGDVLLIAPCLGPPEVCVAGVLRDTLSMPDEGIEFKELAFDVANYHQHFGDPVEGDGGCCWRGRLSLEADPWVIDIDAASDVRERINAARSAGGHVITHAGALNRKDGSSFCFADTAEIRSALSLWPSFTRGLWCSPLFWRCRSDCWVDYSVPRLSRWRDVRSWFPYEECAHALGVFPRFVRLLADPVWKDPLKFAIHWYIHANENSAGVEGSLVLVQTALRCSHGRTLWSTSASSWRTSGMVYARRV